jgi:methionyl-tRNA formyltransferase
MHIWKARLTEEPGEGTPGRLSEEAGRLLAECGGRTMLELSEVQLEGRKRMPAAAFLQGHRIEPGENLG